MYLFQTHTKGARKMPLTDQDLTQLLTLARLQVPAEQRDQLRTDLASILSHMDALARVETPEAPPLAAPKGPTLPTRPDEVHPPRDSGLAQARHQRDGLIQVPRVME